MEEFELTKDHLKLIENVYLEWQDVETGAPGIDPKRPYGNSYVPSDVAEILGWKVDDEMTDEQEREALDLHHETLTALSVILQTKSFKTGTYIKKEKYGGRWERKK